MRQNSLRLIWSEGRAALGGWLTVPSGFSAEIMAHCGIRLGLRRHAARNDRRAQDDRDAPGDLVVGNGSLVRVPRNEAGVIGKCLDAERGE